MLSNCGAGEDSWELPWTARRSNQSILKEIKLDIYWKDWCWSSNTLATWSKESTHWKDPDAGKDGGQEEKGMTEDEMVGWHHWLDGHEFKQALGVVMDREAWCAAVHGFTKSWTWLSNWITTTYCKEIQPVHSEDQPWVFFGRNDAKAETPVLWPPYAKSWPIGRDSDAGRDWGQEEKGTTEDEMAGWHHWLDGREFKWTPGAGDGQGGLVCCDSWGRKESDTTERLNWTEDHSNLLSSRR